MTSAALASTIVPLYAQVDSILEQYPATACKAGCAHCCYIPLDATAAELVLMVEHLLESRTAAELETIRAVANEQADKVKAGDLQTRLGLRTACPVLIDNRCSAYEHRPVHCRGHHSLDVTVCEQVRFTPDRVTELPLQDMRRRWVSSKAAEMVVESSTEANRDSRIYDFRSALAVGLADPTQMRATWESGKAVFPDWALAR